MEIRGRDAHAAYLAAAIDGEGHVSFRRSSRDRPARLISVVNTDREFIAACARACEVLGIEYRIRERAPDNQRRTKVLYELVISRRAELEKVAALVPIKILRKRKALLEGLAAYRPETPWPEIREMVLAGASLREMAERFDVSQSCASSWRRQVAERPPSPPGRPRVALDEERARELRESGLTHQQIADELGVSVGTVWNRLHARTR